MCLHRRVLEMLPDAKNSEIGVWINLHPQTRRRCVHVYIHSSQNTVRTHKLSAFLYLFMCAEIW